MDWHEIRETFLRFYEERGHRRYASASLIPNDPSILLTIAGMIPFKPFFMGDADPPSPRAVSYQKCVRTNDIENVGRTTRHLSMFEMLGNFSFGDYFKRQAIAWAWELSLEHYGLDPERIWVTVYDEDEDSEGLWLEETDLPAERIQRLGAEDNYWWTNAAGPGGPNTEMFYDRGPAHGAEGGPVVDDERYLEYYNLVFMQHELDADGRILGDLPAQNVDTGLGLERLSVILQDADNIFLTDVYAPMLELAQELTERRYGDDPASDLSLRVLAEHARTATFLIADGVLPAKEGRGYVLRRLLRRAVRHAHLLGTDHPVMEPLVDQVVDSFTIGYPELERQRGLVTRVARAEEEDFGARLRQGMDLVGSAIDEVRAADAPGLSGDVAFKLHDTYGFPIDLTAEIAADAGLELDRDRFEALMDEQRRRARAAAKRADGGTTADDYRQAAAVTGAVEFLGYERIASEARIGAIVVPGGTTGSASEGDDVEVVLDRTPFYAEGGGQVGDVGILETPTARLTVLDTQSPLEGLIVHRARVTAGEVRTGQDVHAVVDADRRIATARSHSATHVLHATIKEVLGDHAQQAGSLVQPGRLRFDFPHFEGVARDQLAEVEEIVNLRVLRDPAVRTEVMDLDDARAAGAVANFGDRYGQIVRVVTIGDFSKELCGGTHVPTGATIGTVHIVREESIGSNTRRIEALTGQDAFRYASREMQVAEEVARLLNTSTDEVVERVTALVGRLRATEKELQRAREAGRARQAVELADEAEAVGEGRLLSRAVTGASMDDLRQLAHGIRGRLGGRAVVVLGTATDDGKAQLIAAVGRDLADAGVQARTILHPAAQVVGGGAGGKGDLAQAGGRDGSKLSGALDVAAREARTVLEQA